MTINDGRIGYRELINFFKESARKLDENGQEDSAFYFEQVSEYLTRNPHKGLQDKPERILGL